MKLHSKVADLWNNGKFDAYAFPGGYPVVYLDRDNCHLCADCATESQSDEFDGSKAVGVFTHYEGPVISCNECSTDIESAYGDSD
jgi:hypothetical protein